MEPTGATIVIMVSVPTPNQNEAAEPLGGLALTCAGIAVDIVVSEISTMGAKSTAVDHNTLQVDVAPCEAGGAQMETLWIFTELAINATVVFATVQTAPAIPRKSVCPMVVAAPEVDEKRYV